MILCRVEIGLDLEKDRDLGKDQDLEGDQDHKRDQSLDQDPESDLGPDRKGDREEEDQEPVKELDRAIEAAKVFTSADTKS